jgi:DNA adenine methylase
VSPAPILIPFLKWAGGKRWLVKSYPKFFNVSFNRYVEPFLGGGAVFFGIRPERALLSDSNAELIATYKAVRFDWEAVVQRLRMHHRSHSKDMSYYYVVRESAPTSIADKATKFIYLNRTCFNGLYRVNLKGSFNVPKGTKDAVILETDDFAAVSKRLKEARIRVADFEDILDVCGPNDFAFIDPPYTVKHNNNGFVKYNETIFSWKDQERLASAVRRFADRGGRALVTNAAHPSVRRLYEAWTGMEVLHRQSLLASDNSFRAHVAELAICVGYSPPDVVTNPTVLKDRIPEFKADDM